MQVLSALSCHFSLTALRGVVINRKVPDPNKKDEISAKRAHEIIDRLQNENPIFQPRAVYDGKANLFATRQLIQGAQTVT